MLDYLDIYYLFLILRAGIMAGGGWQGAGVARRERVVRAARKTPAEAGGDALGVLPLAKQRDNNEAHHHAARVPASGRRNLLDLLLEEPNKVNCNL